MCITWRERDSTFLFVHVEMEVGECISTCVLQLLCLPFGAGTSDLETDLISRFLK